MNNINKYVIRNANGTVNIDASVNSFREELQEFAKASDEECIEIVKNIKSVLSDKEKGMVKDNLINKVINMMNVPDEKYSVMFKRVTKIIDDNSSGENAWMVCAKGIGCKLIK